MFCTISPGFFGVVVFKLVHVKFILLFLIPADAKDIKAEYEILLNELRKYNPELLDKKRLLAISKIDMLDDELLAELKKEVPQEISCVFISSVAQKGIQELKDLIWKTLHDEK